VLQRRRTKWKVSCHGHEICGRLGYICFYGEWVEGKVFVIDLFVVLVCARDRGPRDIQK